MCLEGNTYCVPVGKIEERMQCGYSLGPCDMPQSEACVNSTASPEPPTCVCSGRLVSITFRYTGPSFANLGVFAKKNCNIQLGDYAEVMTGDVFTVDAEDGGLSYLKNHTYFEWRGVGRYKIPTNCNNNPIGQDFFPFQIIGWTDTEGNTCDINTQNMTEIDSPNRAVESLEEEDVLKQFPNPADNNTTFEFSVTEDQEVNVSILNINGQIIGQVYNGIANAKENYRFEHDITSFQSGIYYVVLKTSNGMLKKKFVVLK
jgi:hypothetical protein